MRFGIISLVIGVLSAGGSLASAASLDSIETGPIKVEVVMRDGRYQLLRGGQPYQVKGGGIESGDLKELAARGGNSIRNWSTHSAQMMLDQAHELGITVSLCLNIERERHGFDYNDAQAVAQQLEQARRDVMRFRDHPALLSWIIGNELNHDYSNPKVYDAVNDISKMIHELDPNHPTTSTLASFSTDMGRVLNERAPDLDFISIQAYGDLVNLPKYIKKAKFKRPLMVTEWGAIGHWEMPTTFWGAPIEQTSSEKADNYQKMYDSVVSRLAPYNIGNYVFYWGQKQERTPTWYGLFLESGESTEVVDVMQTIWTGHEPPNRAPRLKSMRLNNRTAHNNAQLKPGQTTTARVKASDPDGDTLRYTWQVRLESTATEVGGDAESVPPLVSGIVDDRNADQVTVIAPTRPGAYRLFVEVHDDQGHAAHANIPFLVRP
jgi:hypothetical protein